ncbi:MAG: Sec-independent protein secretion pathway component TatC [uncultured archaeon A07HB70]|nr:MAG: Sec-independent protein secretion pathway component TatC [uncultured archaeon A07HB70]
MADDRDQPETDSSTADESDDGAEPVAAADEPSTNDTDAATAAGEGRSVVAEPTDGATGDERSPDDTEPTPPVTGDEMVGTETADGGVARPTTAGDAAPASSDGLFDAPGGAPEEDVEMPLTDHIEEMINRLAVVLLVGGVVALAVFPVADQLVNYLWNTHIPGAATIADRRPRLYGPLELPLTEIKVASLAGLLVGVPVLVYQSYRFMRPGLYPRERRYYLAAVPTSLVLAGVGVSFAHFVVLPAIFAYLTSYTTGTALVAFGLKETFNLILLLMGYMAVVFQIPLLIQLGIMMGLVSRRWLEDRRLLFWGGFAGLSFLVSPDPTGMAPIIIAATMITLFEGTLALLRWTGQ